MLNNITIGTYIPYNSPIHNMNPLAKIISLVILLVAIFLINNLYIYAISAVLIITIIKVANLSIKQMLKQMKIIFFMFIFLFFINIFMIKTGYIVFSFFGIDIYSGALMQTSIILFRLTLMIFLSSILTMATKPLDLTLGIEQLLNPLKRFSFPSHEVAMMISIALRFIPTLVEETNKIMVAQISRGVDFESNKLNVKIKAVIALLIPLFVASFKRAEELANAMEARGYNPSAERTRFITFSWTNKDSVAVAISLLYLGTITWFTLIN